MRTILSVVCGSVAFFITAACLLADGAGALPAGFFDLTGQAGLPSYLKCDQGTRGGTDGLHNGQIKTVDTALFKKDFTLDVIFQTDDVEKRDAGEVGIGEFGHEGGWLLNSLECRFGGKANSLAQIVFHHQSNTPKLAEMKSAGPHLLRFEKAGNVLSFKLVDEYTGEDPDKINYLLVHRIKDFRSQTPFLNRLNSPLYLAGNMNWKAVRLSVDGKLDDPGQRADAGIAPVADNIPFSAFGPASRLPGFLNKPASESADLTRFTEEGWRPMDIYRSRLANYLKKDFTLDLVIHYSPGEMGSMIIGLGENGRDSGNWILNSVCAAVSGPGDDGELHDTFHDFWNEPSFGKFGPDHAGPNLIRMQRRGDTLMFAACADCKDKFDPDFLTIMPSLHYQAPYLTEKNGYIFFGGTGVIDKLRLVVDGKSINPSTHQPEDDQEIARAASTPPNSASGGRSGPEKPKRDARPDSTPARASDVPAPPDDRPKLALKSDKMQLVPGLNASLLLLEQDQLRRLGADGFTVTQTLTLPGSYRWIGERKNYFVAMSDETKSLDIIDKKTLKITRSIQMDYYRRWDLCLCPNKPTSYVTVEKATEDGFSHVILIVDETNGDVKEPDDFIGKFLRISPDGRTLFSAYNTIYKKGDRLLFNPNQIDVVPDYGDVDILIAYDVSGAMPRELAAKDGPGANCQGLALSTDGLRVSFLSYVGYPLYSNNIAAWDSANFTKRPVAYATKTNKADCKHLAFHPQLPIVAAAAEQGAVCFDRESGQLQKNRLNLPGSFDGTKINDLIFSPDGTNLILNCEQNGEHFLVRVKVNLSPDEAETAKKGPPPPHKAQIPPGEDNSNKA